MFGIIADKQNKQTKTSKVSICFECQMLSLPLAFVQCLLLHGLQPDLLSLWFCDLAKLAWYYAAGKFPGKTSFFVGYIGTSVGGTLHFGSCPKSDFSSGMRSLQFCPWP